MSEDDALKTNKIGRYDYNTTIPNNILRTVKSNPTIKLLPITITY